MSTILVTGGSGFIGSHSILQLLAAGHRVRTTVRNLKREPDVRATLKSAGADAGSHLSFFAADLESDAGWPDAVAGCDYVLHVASPFPSTVPKHEDELIVPAREGALRVLRAARDAGVKRVVLTSPSRQSAMVISRRQRRSMRRIGRTPMAKACSLTRNRRRSPNTRLGISSLRKAAGWSFPWSIQWACSGPFWAPII